MKPHDLLNVDFFLPVNKFSEDHSPTSHAQIVGLFCFDYSGKRSLVVGLRDSCNPKVVSSSQVQQNFIASNNGNYKQECGMLVVSLNKALYS